MSLLALLAAHAAGGGTVDPPPTDDGWGIGTSSDPVWVPDGALTTWRAAREASDTELAEVAFFGDSTSFGEPDGGSTRYPTAYMLRQRATTDGYLDGGIGDFSRSESSGIYRPHPLTYDAMLGESGMDRILAGFGQQTYSTCIIDAEGDWITWQGEGRYARLTYARNGHLMGGFDYQVDGTPVGSVPTATVADPDLFVTTTLDLGTTGLHQIKLTAHGGVPAEPPTIAGVTATGGGTLVAGTYHYVATIAPESGGETNAGASKPVTLTTGQAASVNLPRGPVYGGTTKIYRGTSAAGPFAFVGSVAVNANGPYSWVDTGTATPGATPPATSTAGKVGLNKADVAVEWINDTGIVWHRYSVPGARALTAVSPYSQYLMRPSRGVALALNAYGINNQQQADDQTETLRADLRTWVDMARAGGASPVLCIPLYERAQGKDTIDPGQTLRRADRFRQVHRDVAIEKQCALVDLGSGGALPGLTERTNPHLSSVEYQAQADYLWDNLLKL